MSAAKFYFFRHNPPWHMKFLHVFVANFHRRTFPAFIFRKPLQISNISVFNDLLDFHNIRLRLQEDTNTTGPTSLHSQGNLLSAFCVKRRQLCDSGGWKIYRTALYPAALYPPYLFLFNFMFSYMISIITMYNYIVHTNLIRYLGN